MASKRLAPLYTEFQLYNEVTQRLGQCRQCLAAACAAPTNATRDEDFADLWDLLDRARVNLDELPALTPGLQHRRAGLRRQLDALYMEATQASLALVSPPRNNVVELASRRAGAR